MKHVFISGAVGIVALAAAGAANAGILTVSQTEAFGPSVPNFTQTLTFNQFNDNGGKFILKSIKIIANLQIEGGLLELDNDGADPASGMASIGATLDLSSGDVALLNNMNQPVIGTLTAANMTAFNLGGTTGDSVDKFNNTGDVDYFAFLGTQANEMGMGFIGGAFLMPYIGVGTFDIDAAVNQIFDFGSIGGIAFAGSPVTANGDVTVIFEYNVIPAPGVVALLGIGGLVGTSRRRRA